MVKIKISEINENTKNNILTAGLESDRFDMPPRFTGHLHTGYTVEVPATHCLRVALVPELANRGLVLLGSGRFTSGRVSVCVLNAGREIISIGTHSPLLEVWVEKVEKFSWELV